MLIEAQPLDFTVIGAPRCGTGCLASMMHDHPSLAIATRSGPGFFADRHPFRPWRGYCEDARALRRLFSAAPPEALLGEIAPLTYFDPLSASRQSNLCPDSRVIVLLRNPVDMLHSLYCFGLLSGWWRGSFEETMARHPTLIDLAFYDRLLTAWRDWFPISQLHVALSEHLFEGDGLALDAMMDFLEVESGLLALPPVFDEARPLLDLTSGPAGIGPLLRRCRSAGTRRLGGSAIARQLGLPLADHQAEPAPVLATDTRLYLLDELDADICRLERSFGLDLAHWRTDQSCTFEQLPDNVVRLPLANVAMLPV